MKFYKTQPHPCSYLPGKTAETVFLDPDEPVTPTLYEALNQAGFRRSGEYIYRPECPDCQRCQSLRVDATAFRPRRRHRRNLKRNADIQWQVQPVQYSDDYWRIYQNYLTARHRDGDMYPPDPTDFYRFLFRENQYGFLLVGRLAEKPAIIAVTDRLDSGLSAVYTFFEPELLDRSPGKLAILKQIQLCREMDLPWLYLGYWLRDVPGMSYKAEFQPAERFHNDNWHSLITD